MTAQQRQPSRIDNIPAPASCALLPVDHVDRQHVDHAPNFSRGGTHPTMQPRLTLHRMIALSTCIVLFPYTVSVGAESGSRASFTLLPAATWMASEHPIWEHTESFLSDPHAVADQRSDQFQLDDTWREDGGAEVPRKQYFRAALEITALLGLVSIFYWGSQIWAEDFDHNVSLETLWEKFTGETIRFDDNPISINSFPGHPLAGAYYYLIARNHHLSRLESFLWSLTASTLHEFFIEFPELASIADLVSTPLAGSAIGESMYAFGRYLRCAPLRQSALYKIMAFMVDPVYAVNRWIWPDGQERAVQEAMCRGLPPDNAFSLFTGTSMTYYENTDRTSFGFLFGFHGRLLQLPWPGQAVDRKGFVSTTSLTELGLEAIVTAYGFESLQFIAKTVWVAYAHQRRGRDLAGQTTGWSVLAGLASAFEHTQYNADEFEDWIAAVHVLGPAIEFTLMRQDDYLRLGLEVFGDFAMVRSFAFDQYKQQHSLEGLKTVLQEENYYYAIGVYLRSKLEVLYDAYRLVAEYTYAHYDSIEGANRLPAPRDFHLVDTQAKYSVTVGRRLDFLTGTLVPNHPVWLEAEWRRIARTGWIADDDVSYSGGTMWLLLRVRMNM